MTNLLLPVEQDSMKKPQRSPCLPVRSQPLLHRWHLLQRDWPHSPQVPLSDAEEALSATRVLSDYTHEDLRAFFVQAFWLCHSAVTILLHLPASTASFPHTPSPWKSFLASSFRVNTDGNHWDTTLENEVPEFPTEGKWHAVCSNPARANLACGLEPKLTASTLRHK